MRCGKHTNKHTQLSLRSVTNFPPNFHLLSLERRKFPECTQEREKEMGTKIDCASANWRKLLDSLEQAFAQLIFYHPLPFSFYSYGSYSLFIEQSTRRHVSLFMYGRCFYTTRGLRSFFHQQRALTKNQDETQNDSQVPWKLNYIPLKTNLNTAKASLLHDNYQLPLCFSGPRATSIPRKKIHDDDLTVFILPTWHADCKYLHVKRGKIELRWNEHAIGHWTHQKTRLTRSELILSAKYEHITYQNTLKLLALYAIYKTKGASKHFELHNLHWILIYLCSLSPVAKQISKHTKDEQITANAPALLWKLQLVLECNFKRQMFQRAKKPL